jgi:hypothetical protein
MSKKASEQNMKGGGLTLPLEEEIRLYLETSSKEEIRALRHQKRQDKND